MRLFVAVRPSRSWFPLAHPLDFSPNLSFARAPIVTRARTTTHPSLNTPSNPFPSKEEKKERARVDAHWPAIWSGLLRVAPPRLYSSADRDRHAPFATTGHAHRGYVSHIFSPRPCVDVILPPFSFGSLFPLPLPPALFLPLSFSFPAREKVRISRCPFSRFHPVREIARAGVIRTQRRCPLLRPY